MAFPDYDDYDALGLAGLVRAGQATSQELLDEALGRIEASNATLNAVTVHGADQAHRAIEASLPEGPFTGVPMLLKDLYQPCAGLPVTNGSRFSDPAPARSGKAQVAPGHPECQAREIVAAVRHLGPWACAWG